MPFVTVNGVAHHVQELGAGAPVVMVHGLVVGSLASWYFTVASRLASRHRVRMYDLRGHGKSAHAVTGYDTRTLAGDLAALVELGGDGPVDVVGHSWGALVALRFAIEHPDRVRRLAMVEAPLPPSSAGELAAFVAAGNYAEALPDPAMLTGRRARALARLALETSLVADLRAEPDLTDAELARVRGPWLAVYGDRSTCAPAGSRLARAGARHVVLSGGHYLHLDAKDALGALLEEFLDG